MRCSNSSIWMLHIAPLRLCLLFTNMLQSNNARNYVKIENN